MESKMCLNDLRSYSRHWLTEFMEIYRTEECLWQGKHPDYANHGIRNASYDKLVKKLKEVEPNPDRAMVVRKINSLRSAFRREYRKKISKDNYESRLWYFDKLMFIADQNPKRLHNAQKRELKINFDDDSMDYEQEEESEKHEINQIEEQHIALATEPIRCHVIKSENNNGDSSLQQQQNQSIPQQPQQSSLKVLDITSLDVNSQREIQQAVDSIEQQHQQQQMQNAHHQGQQTQVTQIHHQQVPTIQISREHLPTLFNSTTFDHPRQNDEFDAVGTNVASKLRVMNHTQRIIAEKVISDILFNGQLGNLNISSTLVN
ncbi:uncharacterized protein LOC129942337 [Eupeodes corollae]|uniref:uncharacterized protein LOC129942337 n=1 Tax=Eupeodes corollae TaxID=290404 RepID=UPI002493C631|nr:uncharacterized protein LOC129942337 [Eupeodes corollae]